MVTEVKDGKTLQVERERINGDGFTGEVEVRLMPRRQWYRKDGTAVFPEYGGPTDAYHMKKYYARGWYLSDQPHSVEHIQTADDTPAGNYDGFGFDASGYGIQEEY